MSDIVDDVHSRKRNNDSFETDFQSKQLRADHENIEDLCQGTFDDNQVAAKSGADEVHGHVVNDTVVESNSGDAMVLLHSQDDIDQDPNWDVIAQNGPAANDVPQFLSARGRRQEAEMRFERALDEAHGNLKDLVDAFCSVAANVINEKRMKLNAMEAEIKHEFQENEDVRANMSKKLEEFAANAQAQFQELMNRLANANGLHNSSI